MTTLSHRIQLDPTPSQVQALRRAVGCARFAWNWGLAEWKRQYAAHLADAAVPKPTTVTVKAAWAAVKHAEFPWLAESPANANLQPFTFLGGAFDRFFKKKAKYPRFKKKGQRDSFYVDNQKMRLDGKRVKLPKIGTVKLCEALRFDGKVLKGTVSREADRWFLSVSVELHEPKRPRTGDGVVGVDLGLTALATLSTGETVENPRALKHRLRALRRAQRACSRRVKGSNNRKKAAIQIAKLHWKVKNVRQDALHKLTTRLCRENQAVGIEDLNVKGMVKNRTLARAIQDAGWGEFRRQMAYKAPLFGTTLVVADRFFPSSKTCAVCGAKKAMPMAERVYRCGCGHIQDRDVNAANNLRANALATLGMRGRDACEERVSQESLGSLAVLDEAGSRVGP